MTYSDNKARLEEMLPYLGPLTRGENVEWRIVTGSPNTVAWRIREALRIARIYASDYPELAQFAADYSIAPITVIENGETVAKVRARRRTPMLLAPTPSTARPIAPMIVLPERVTIEGPAVDQIAQPLGILATGTHSFGMHNLHRIHEQLRGKQTTFSVMDVYRQLGVAKPTLNFPDADLTEEELTELFLWAGGHQPPLMLLHHAPGLTVARFDPIVAEHSWHPTQEEDTSADTN